jgi:S-DNA-T family DNA segregation ATPase FtsK/SpoIIIE
MLMPLTRRSLSVGMPIVLASNLHNHLPSRFFSMFGERITFKQSNTDAYLDIVGRGASELDDQPGRGYIRKDRRPLAFQAALPIGLLNDDGRPQRPEAEELRQLSGAMANHAESLTLRSTPEPIRVLPQLVSLEEMLAGQNSDRNAQIVIGQGGNLEVAELDLQRSGPHFMIVGPPLSGKTTALYNVVFALARRYDPDRAIFVLVDLQRRFVEYGGRQNLKGLPHTLAVINEVEELEALMPQLQAEASKLAEQNQRDLFMIIDDFDDFNEEIHRLNELSEALTLLVRRYGRDGFHIIAASSPEGNSSDLKRRIMASNYGLGLRTSSAIEALRVMRTPAGVRDKELNLGRGYIAKSGQTTMVQVGSPFHRPDQKHHSIEISDLQRGDALDTWVNKIANLYDEQAAWSAQPEESVSSSSGPAVDSPEYRLMQRSIIALRKHMLSEVEYLKQHNGTRSLILERFIALESSDWQNQSALSELLKESYLAQQVALGMDEASIRSLLQSYRDEDILFGLEGMG